MSKESKVDGIVQASSDLTERQETTEQKKHSTFIVDLKVDEEKMRAGTEVKHLKTIRREKQAAAASSIAKGATLQSVKPKLKSHHRVRGHAIPSPMPWTGREPAFRIASAGGFFGINEIHPKDLVHTLTIGGTGSGKTVSNVLPLLKAQLRYAVPSGQGLKRSSVLGPGDRPQA